MWQQNIGHEFGLLSDSIHPSPEPMLTYYKSICDIHLCASNFTRSVHEFILVHMFGDYSLEISTTSPRGQWNKYYLFFFHVPWQLPSHSSGKKQKLQCSKDGFHSFTHIDLEVAMYPLIKKILMIFYYFHSRLCRNCSHFVDMYWQITKDNIFVTGRVWWHRMGIWCSKLEPITTSHSGPHREGTSTWMAKIWRISHKQWVPLFLNALVKLVVIYLYMIFCSLSGVTGYYLDSLPGKTRTKYTILHSQYHRHSCLWLGDRRSQGISSHGIGIRCLE